MKTLNSTVIKIAAALFVMVALFFSCLMNESDMNGTLVLKLPGVARSAVSSAYTDRLSYLIECAGPESEQSRSAGPGDTVSLTLSPGDWDITVTVKNVAGEDIGSSTVKTAIEGGKTTTIAIPITIETDRNAITSFSITSPVSAPGVINGNNITVDVPFGTPLFATRYSLIHTGRSINPSSSFLDFMQPRNFTVTAENGVTQTYTVTVNIKPPVGGKFLLCASWTDVPWSAYGLSSVTAPGTVINILDGIPPTQQFFLMQLEQMYAGLSGFSKGYVIMLNSTQTQYDNFDTSITGLGYVNTGTVYANASTNSYLSMNFTDNLLTIALIEMFP